MEASKEITPNSSTNGVAAFCDIATGWVDRFNLALTSGNEAAIADMFLPDGYWRNIVGFERGIRTTSGAPQIAREIYTAAARSGVAEVRLDSQLAPPMLSEFAGRRTLDAWLRFETAISTGIAQIRLDLTEGPKKPRAWTLMTAIDELKGFDLRSERRKRDSNGYNRDWKGPNWNDQRKSNAAYSNREPRVLIVGAGHGGLTVAAWLNALNVDNLVVDRQTRIGDNWRKRYNSLKLHSPTDSVHFPFLNYPPGWPKYIPKDKIANWMEFYADAMEVNFWPETEFVSAAFDPNSQSWEARVKIGDTAERMLRPAHIVIATSQIGVPHIPNIKGIGEFKGPTIHSSQFSGGADWAGKRVLVLGTGTSAHDIAQELHAHSAEVTMVQRGITEVIQIEPSAHLYLDALYELEGLSLELKDLIACSAPIEVVEIEHRRLTKLARANDSKLLDRLERVGFKVERDPDGCGWPMKYFTRGGGYYFNVGCSDLIADGEIKIIQFDQIESFAANGPVLLDGRNICIDLIVLATGYKGYEHTLPRWFGNDIAERVGKVWGIDPQTGELRNMWKPTGQSGLWLAGGSFVHSRIYSKYIALQIKAEEEKLCGL